MRESRLINVILTLVVIGLVVYIGYGIAHRFLLGPEKGGVTQVIPMTVSPDVAPPMMAIQKPATDTTASSLMTTTISTSTIATATTSTAATSTIPPQLLTSVQSASQQAIAESTTTIAVDTSWTKSERKMQTKAKKH